MEEGRLYAPEMVRGSGVVQVSRVKSQERQRWQRQGGWTLAVRQDLLTEISLKQLRQKKGRERSASPLLYRRCRRGATLKGTGTLQAQ